MAPRSRWTRADWIEHALAQLAADGPDGVTVDALCEGAGRTRGSLYHHFDDHDALLCAVLSRWRERYTEEVIRNIQTAELEGELAAARLNDLATSIDFDVEVGIRRLAANRPWLRNAVTAADRRRIRFLSTLREQAGASKKDAEALAELEYAAFVGAQHLAPIFTPRRLRQLYHDLETMMSRTGAAR